MVENSCRENFQPKLLILNSSIKIYFCIPEIFKALALQVFDYKISESPFEFVFSFCEFTKVILLLQISDKKFEIQC